MKRYRNLLIKILLISVFPYSPIPGLFAQSQDFPAKHWQVYSTPEEAGWSSEKLAEAKSYFAEIGGAAAMVIYKGKVLVAWGDITRRYNCHSMRKSLLSTLFGIYVENKEIDISTTLKDLGIDDNPPLTDEEKQATIEYMLKARSGVYHTAAYEAQSMKDARPARGYHPPNTYWYYNNWDFNTLVTIFNQETGKDFFKEFNNKIALPIGMEDFRLLDTYYHYEYENSIHPAYPFRMSARDLARFGFLVLNDGKWDSEKIIPRKWINQMSTPYSLTGWGRGAYGYMWWISGDGILGKAGMFSAYGAGGHRVDVIPDEDLVFVFRVNTFQNNYISNDKSERLLKMILDARVSDAKKHPSTQQLLVSEKDEGAFFLSQEEMDGFVNAYVFESGIGFKIIRKNEDLILKSPMMGNFVLIPVVENEFIFEDAGYRLVFTIDQQGKPVDVTITFSEFDVETGRPLN